MLRKRDLNNKIVTEYRLQNNIETYLTSTVKPRPQNTFQHFKKHKGDSLQISIEETQMGLNILFTIGGLNFNYQPK